MADVSADARSWPVEAVIMDVGSTVFYAQEKEQSARAVSLMVSSLGESLGWDESKQDKFTDTYRQCLKLFQQRKKHICTGSALDEGCLGEPLMKQHIRNALNEFGVTIEECSDEMIEIALLKFEAPKIENSRVIEGLVDFLGWAQKKGLKLALCSNDHSPRQLRARLERCKLTEWFDIVIISAAVNRRKPDWRMVQPIIDHWYPPSESVDRSSEWYWSHLQRCVFIGDKCETDILVAKHCGMRGVLCKFFDRDSDKWSKRSKIDPSFFRLHSGPYMGAITSLWAEQQIGMAEFSEPEGIVNKWSEVSTMVEKLSITPPSNGDRIKVGVLLTDTKFDKLEKRKWFPTDWRIDMDVVRIELFGPDFCETMTEDELLESLLKQGPFDVIIAKLNTFVVKARFGGDEATQRGLRAWHRYLDDHCITPADLSDDKSDGDSGAAADVDSSLSKSEAGVSSSSLSSTVLSEKIRQWKAGERHACFLFGGNLRRIEQLATDRGRMIECINGAHIPLAKDRSIPAVAESEAKEESSAVSDADSTKIIDTSELRFPPTVLVKPQTLSKSEEPLVALSALVSGLKWPLLVKPRHTGSTDVSGSSGHGMFVVRDSKALSEIVVDSTLDWIVQQHIPHSGRCLKVFVVGAHVFATANDSIDVSDESIQSCSLDATQLSKRQHSDQDEVRGLAKLIVHSAESVIEATECDVFGMDLLIEEDTKQPWIVDFNFFPSFKSVECFSGIAWQSLLQQRRTFLSRLDKY